MIHKTVVALPNLVALDAVAKQLAAIISPRSWVYLQGDLGAGKTTFAKTFIWQKGCTENVTSPTYALMQDYHTDSGTVIHCDLYRLAESEELYDIGLFELADAHDAIVLVEWPSKGCGVLPPADYDLQFEITDNQTQRRELTITAYSSNPLTN